MTVVWISGNTRSIHNNRSVYDQIYMLCRTVDLHIRVAIIVAVMAGCCVLINEITADILTTLEIFGQLCHFAILVDTPSVVATRYGNGHAILCCQLFWLSVSIVFLAHGRDEFFHFFGIKCRLHIVVTGKPCADRILWHRLGRTADLVSDLGIQIAIESFDEFLDFLAILGVFRLFVAFILGQIQGLLQR